LPIRRSKWLASAATLTVKMSVQQMEILAPLATPLPEPPAGEAFTSDQWQILMSIMDTIIPSIQRASFGSDGLSNLTIPDEKYNAIVVQLKKATAAVPGAHDGESLEKFLDEKPSDNPDFQDLLKRSLVHFAREDARKGLAFILSTLK
jgi:hypothetical protein